MGLMDFFRKGKEKPASNPAAARPQHSTPAGGNTTGQQNTAAPKPAAATPAPAAPRDYVVQSGDSLSQIARKFYGNANDWQKIWQANKDKIKDPNLIQPGQRIVIP